MSLPGLQISTPVVATVAAPIVHDLEANTEWRFEVAFGGKIEIKARNASCLHEAANIFHP